MSKKKKPKKAQPPESTEGDAPTTAGWDAIDAALRPLYGTTEPLHYASVPHFAAGGEDPLDGISAYRVESGASHWHIVTYGFSELYAKETDDPEVSGFGFELTFRLARGPLDEAPPSWALSFLQNLARYVFRSGNRFAPGHFMNLNGPIALGEETAIRAIAFVEDPQLRSVSSPNGHLQFLQVVGLTLDELRAAMAWDTEKLLAVLAGRDPLLVTDIRRRSLLEDRQLRLDVETGTARDGSSQDGTFVDGLSWERADDRITLRLGAVTITNVVALIRGRTLFGRDFFVQSRTSALTVRSAQKGAGWKIEDDALVLELDGPLAAEIAGALAPERGEHRFARLPGLTLEVVPTQVTNAQGEVIEVVG